MRHRRHYFVLIIFLPSERSQLSKYNRFLYTNNLTNQNCFNLKYNFKTSTTLTLLQVHDIITSCLNQEQFKNITVVNYPCYYFPSEWFYPYPDWVFLNLKVEGGPNRPAAKPYKTFRIFAKIIFKVSYWLLLLV